VTPQSSFILVAPILPGRVGDLRTLLTSMNRRPGVVDPENGLVPFGRLESVHFARFVVLEDVTLADITAYGAPANDCPLSLAFLADFDGPPEDFLATLIDRAGGGLRRIFAHCEGFTADTDLRRWMRGREHRAAANYVNWRGRTMVQVREEAALRDALVSHLRQHAAAMAAMDARGARDTLAELIREEQRVGRLALSAEQPAPAGWRVGNAVHAIAGPILAVLLLPLLVLYLPLFVYQLRRRERQDPEIVPRPDHAHLLRLAELEDHATTNQFSAIGSLKPGRFRRWTVMVALWGLDWAARHFYNRGHLTRVSTIHFARWVLLDDNRRVLFASNYDGSLEAYMDDFINKVAWGLNLVFSNGVGYPRTDWLVCGGAKDEQRFKRFIRRHEVPTEVWYNAHPGLTAVDLARNTRIRQGLERPAATESEIRDWLRLL
jgi:hypothetical protein